MHSSVAAAGTVVEEADNLDSLVVRSLVVVVVPLEVARIVVILECPHPLVMVALHIQVVASLVDCPVGVDYTTYLLYI